MAPVVSSSELAPISVVTGASGFLATELIKQLLSKGHNVRGTVRDPAASAKTAHLRALGDALPGTLTLVAADLSVPGSFDNAVDGATYVFHVATPADFESKDPQREIVDAAVEGTRNVFGSVEKSRRTVQKVVITSSIVAVYNLFGSPTNRVFTEADWNEESKPDAGGLESYAVSKVLAERVATELADKAGVGLVHINPSWILGPVTPPIGVGFSVQTILKTLFEGGADLPQPAIALKVDVRDVALAHIRGAEIPSAKGRYIISHETTTSVRTLTNILKKRFPGLKFGDGEDFPPQRVVDTSKARKELGLQLIPLEESLVDAALTEFQLGIATPQRV
ncbi:hypothetical protein WJX72_010574 [[Myrmecia] bisecta]|uniref:Flavanone 4-reductase n=1 Tax=[Myrmecia] bisecta TaxID=41462 RepID=A0AAW1P8L0_9CHLO